MTGIIHPGPARPLPWMLLTSAVLLWTVGASPLQAQSILNTERFQLAEVSGGHAAVDLSGMGRLGNTRILEANLEGIVGRLAGRHWPRVIFGGTYLREDGEDPILDQRFLQLRYSYLLSSRTRSFHFLQGQVNETLLLRSRWLVGTGIRRSIAQSDHVALHLGTGAMFEAERLQEDRIGVEDPRRSEVVRMANLAVLTYSSSNGVEVVNVAYFQPRLGTPSDFRALNEFRMGVPVSDRLSAALSVNWRHDSRPPTALRRDDLTYRFGLTFALN